MAHRTYIFVGGGSGGHIFPNLAIAERIAQRDPQAECFFICADRPIDARILDGENERFEPIPARPFRFRPVAFAKLAWRWGECVRRSRRVIRALKSQGEVHIVATGGYVCPPVMQAACAEKVPATLVNLDATPGLANRFAAKRCEARFTAAEGSALSSWTRIRPIVRQRALAPGDARECRRRLGLDPDRPTLVVIGGSQGARSLNNLMLDLLDRRADALADWQVFHQTGQTDFERVKEAHISAAVPGKVAAFFDRMGEVWGAADLAVARAGAGTVGEIWANAVPAILLPYPFHRDAHQARNAEPLVRVGGAIVERDRADRWENFAAAGTLMLSLLGDEPEREKRRRALRSLDPADGAETVAERLMQY